VDSPQECGDDMWLVKRSSLSMFCRGLCLTPKVLGRGRPSERGFLLADDAVGRWHVSNLNWKMSLDKSMTLLRTCIMLGYLDGHVFDSGKAI